MTRIPPPSLPDTMPANNQHAIRVTVPAATGPQSRARKQFNTLVKKLETERARLAVWRDELPKIRALADSELFPLIEAFGVCRRQLLVRLDQAWADKKLSKKDREKISDIICNTAGDALLTMEDDPVISAIYDRHSTLMFGAETDADRALMRDMVAAATGIELDEDTDLSSPGALREAMRNKVEALARAEEAEEARRASKPRPAKVSAREARQQAEESKLKQSVRDIFRKLASLLHPDRETDPAERTRKTALMQRANAAYAAEDLLGLLELQLEVEQVDQAGLDNLDDDRIKQYNKLLASQVNEIQMDITALDMALSIDMGLEHNDHRTPQALVRDLRGEIREMQADLEYIEGELALCQDIRQLKAWLKDYQIGANDPGLEDFF
jgi:hypothetical protein